MAEKKKALIVATVGGFLPQFEQGNVRILQQMGYEVHYASNFSVPNYHYKTSWFQEQGIVCHHTEFERSPWHFLRNVKAYLKLKRLIMSEGYRLIHCHTPVAGVLTRLSAKKYRKDKINTGKRERKKRDVHSVNNSIRVVYTAHGFHFYRGSSVLSWLLYYPVECRMAIYTDALLTINREDYERSKRFCVEWQCRTAQIPGVGIPAEKYRKNWTPQFILSAEKKREELGAEPDDFLLVSVGELNANKNHEIVIRALSGLNQLRLKYIICGEGKQRKLLEQLIERLGLSERVCLPGYRTDVTEILNCADCFVFPSKREGLGVAALEAMAAGLPVISGDNRGTREYMLNGSNGIVCRNRPEDYREAILRLAKDSVFRAGMGRKAEKTAADYDDAHAGAAMREIYQCL